MLTKMTRKELIELITGLQEGEKKQFCTWLTEDGEGSCWYAVQKTEWLDSKIVMIGGYSQYTVCLDYTTASSTDLKEYVEEFVWDYCNREGITEAYVNMGEIEE